MPKKERIFKCLKKGGEESFRRLCLYLYLSTNFEVSTKKISKKKLEKTVQNNFFDQEQKKAFSHLLYKQLWWIIFLRMYVCMYLCTYIRMYASIFVSMYVSMYVSIFVFMFVILCASMYLWLIVCK